jgi:hypothetical protein
LNWQRSWKRSRSMIYSDFKLDLLYIQPQVGTPERQPRPVMVGRLSRYFETEDDRAEVLTVCKLYTAYLDKLVGDFLKAHPEKREKKARREIARSA